jgi:DNA-binding IclR family transcriptional regulator
VPRNEYVHSIERAVDVLEVVAGASDGLNQAFIAKALGLRRSSVRNIVRTLAHRGMLVRADEGGRYRLSGVMAELCAREARWNRQVLSQAIPAIIRLSREAKGDAYLVQLVGRELIARFLVPASMDHGPLLMHTYQMRAYGTGLLYQAYMSGDQLTHFRSKHPVSEMDSSFWKSREILAGFLVLVREHGYLTSMKNDIMRVCAPILDGEGRIAAMLAVVKPYEPGEGKVFGHCAGMVVRAARDLTAVPARGRG